MSEENFVSQLLSDQPFIPKYFPFDVAVNKKGAWNYAQGIYNVPRINPVMNESDAQQLDPDTIIIDARPHRQFKKAHLPNAVNLMNDNKFETWLGSIVNPGEKFYLAADNDELLDALIARAAKIGYEAQIKAAFITHYGNKSMEFFDSHEIKNNPEAFTIVDVRNPSETSARKIFSNAIHIPLDELRERTNEIPLGKPIVVHCGGGYRSAAGSSIIKSKLNGNTKVYDLSEAVKKF